MNRPDGMCGFAAVLAVPVVALVLALGGCGDSAKRSETESGQAKAVENYERGPHRGRILRSGDFAVEVTIFEDGVEPEFHVYPYFKGKPADPAQVALSMTLTRLSGRKDKFTFRPREDFLVGQGVVREPHSFDVEVNVTFADASHGWSYSSYEGRTTIAAEAADAAGVKAEAAGPAELLETIDVPGRIVLAPQGRAEIRATYPGRITEMTKSVGQIVKQGETLVRIEASDSLRSYAITSPISGTVIERSANVGDVPSQPIYVVADSRQLQAIFFAFPRDAEKLREGQSVAIRGLGGQTARSTVRVLLPSADPATQTVRIYADLDNPEGAWRAGMAVEGDVTVSASKVPLAVRSRALQRFRDFTVVFAKVDQTYEVRMLKLGRRTPEWTEVLGGLEPGEVYVSDNSFLIRADIEKAGASHDH